MNLSTKLKRIKDDPRSIISFLEGQSLKRLYYSRLRFLIPKHIREQFEYRLKWMDQECFSQGSCRVCGCETPALQMASKSCDNKCYPPMMDKFHWQRFKEGYTIVLDVNEPNRYWAKGPLTGQPMLMETYDLPNGTVGTHQIN